MLPDTFPRTGLHTYRPTNQAPAQYQVFGERSSATTYARRLIGRNTVLQATDVLGWKHGLPAMIGIPTDTAVIVLVRNAADWVRSMHAKPWHCTPAMQALPFSDFIRTEWDSFVDHPRFFDNLPDHTVGQPLQADRHPFTGTRYRNIFALRRAKLIGQLSILKRQCACAVISAETIQKAPEETLLALCAGFGLPAPDLPFRPINKRLGSKFNANVEIRPQTPRRISDDDMAFLRAELDLDLEARLGYRY